MAVGVVVIVVFVVTVVTQSGSSGLCSNSPFNTNWWSQPLWQYPFTWITNLWNHHLDSPRILFGTPTDRIPNSSGSCGKTFVCHPLPDATPIWVRFSNLQKLVSITSLKVKAIKPTVTMSRSKTSTNTINPNFFTWPSTRIFCWNPTSPQTNNKKHHQHPPPRFVIKIIPSSRTCLAGKHLVCANLVKDSKVTPTAPPKFFEDALTEFPGAKKWHGKKLLRPI